MTIQSIHQCINSAGWWFLFGQIIWPGSVLWHVYRSTMEHCLLQYIQDHALGCYVYRKSSSDDVVVFCASCVSAHLFISAKGYSVPRAFIAVEQLLYIRNLCVSTRTSCAIVIHWVENCFKCRYIGFSKPIFYTLI